MKYRIGIDVGDRSVGLAAIEFDDVGFPIQKLALVTYRHDGGLDPTTGKNPQSRKATAGVARRTRRMRKQRRKRLNKLDSVLKHLGYPVPDQEEPQTYEAWHSRALLTGKKLENEAELQEHLVRAIRHIARHRGWRNPWWRFHQLQNAPVPSPSMLKMIEAADERWPGRVPHDATVGELGALVAEPSTLLRPRTYDAKKHPNTLNNKGESAVLSEKVRQEDLYAEVKKIWARQHLPEDHFLPIVEALFNQVRPYVPQENVGKDPLPGQTKKNRAVKSSLEFTEFRIVQAVANLTVIDRGGKRLLKDDEFDKAVHYLVNFSEEAAPTWGDVAEEIGVPANRLITPEIDGVKLNSAPFDRSSQKILNSKLRKNSEVLKWWDTADWEQRSELIRFLSDATDETIISAEQSGLSDIYEAWPENEREILEGLDFEPGRAAYSTDSLIKLTAYMREHHVGLHEARKEVFNVPDTWQPPRESLDSNTGQPTVDRVLSIVRKFVLACERKWGAPEKIIVEHVRTGLMGPAARYEILREIAKNRNNNDRVRQELIDGGFSAPTRADIRRYRIVQNQDCRCLYCGTTVTVETAELDHIVPRAGGGSSRVDNLVAVCRTCNSEKGKIPFAQWANSSKRSGVSVEEAVERLWSFDKVGVFKGVSGKRLKQQIARRLRQTEEDEPIDERSLASTSYAAVELRQRLETYFNKGKAYGEESWFSVDVYSGSMTRGSRRAGGIDERLLLRGQRDKNRFDVRHHAIDAAVLTLLNRSVARTLEQRKLMQEEARLGSRDTGWKDFQGLGITAVQKFKEWRKTCLVLSDILAEAIEADQIPVITPLRLTPKNGSVHKDTISAMGRKFLGEAWSKDEIQRVQDPELYLLLLDELGKARGLEADEERSCTLPTGSQLSADSEVLVFPEKAASILVGTGAAKIGDSLHHARLYAWKDKKGKLNIGMLRVFGAELPWLMRISGNKDALTAPIHRGAQSYRDMQDKTRKAIEAGLAQEIGWITQGDEIEISPEEFSKLGGELGEFLKILPETRWRIDGFYDAGRLRVRPILLSQEDLPNTVYAQELSKEQFSLLELALTRGLLPSLSNVFEQNSTKVIRRNSLGIPRWKSNGFLPVSLDIARVANEKLGE
ncbi:type II CRISPR RNA-guided endonuclease Cas9 [Rothia aerolata]|uniref:HNH Cas9-type domain-containing protein n=1 Tax=Rothia aerolata TaxID=1812262 RepID=A0A917MUF6_9MICC|nr:type II CRISPR RNA-guided endonuclease Cas9 [Rothia aerolata]GGH64493.1 hypothetical protein GCM10007359_16840 [Rothia aerolata]